ncbi:hypothetical protein CJF42_25715 [Pseudoalteromonas sp. NBT06-2]|uniref:hypothetical protein n=1 Tax=Pseudoalteromonas sp. NBT06-2 TaxID=2025950 RepID=UPI000BA56FBB|nr:hypothetical protein [Pseudoalteromonas sp. NBT06-2]PAJ71625.1 hypothetical protein CJF42_25715 [Pseudoalteromonas sp. NBT06-2]
MPLSRKEFVGMVKDPSSLGNYHSDHGMPPRGMGGDQMRYTCHTAVQHWGYMSLYGGDLQKTIDRIREVTIWDCHKCGESINHMSNAETYVNELTHGAKPLLAKELLYTLEPGDIIITGDYSKGTQGITHSMVFVGMEDVKTKDGVRAEARVIGFNNTSTFTKQVYNRMFSYLNDTYKGKLEKSLTKDVKLRERIQRQLPPKLAPDANEYDMYDETYWSFEDKDGNLYEYGMFGPTHEKAPVYYLKYEDFMANNIEHAKYGYA